MSFWCWPTQLVLTKLIFDHTERRPTEGNFFKNIYLLLVCGSRRETWVSLLRPLWRSCSLNPGCAVGSKCLYPMIHFVSPNCSVGFGIMGRKILLLGVLLQGRSFCKPHCQHRGLRWSSASGGLWTTVGRGKRCGWHPHSTKATLCLYPESWAGLPCYGFKNNLRSDSSLFRVTQHDRSSIHICQALKWIISDPKTGRDFRLWRLEIILFPKASSLENL